jgi:Holliday junction resolvase RusA-like endonuclease
MAKELSFVIYGKVPAKSSSRRIITVRDRPMIISSPECLRYEKDFQIQANIIKKDTFNQERLEVYMIWHTDSFRQDIDSPAKIVFDCCQKNKIIFNDNKIDKYFIERKIDKVSPRIEIKIKEIVENA